MAQMVMKEQKHGKLKSIKAGDWVIVLICVIMILLCLLPILNVFSRSLSSPLAIIQGRVTFFPVDPTLESYSYVLKDKAFGSSMLWTGVLTVICTLISLTVTALCAYPLTYDWLKGNKVINTIIILTMYFNAGTIPNYIWLQSLNLINTAWVLILPGALSVFNMIVLRSFFFSLPESIRESAELDGANPYTILIRIYLPLSTSVLATLALFYAVGRWNGFTDALLYITKPELVPIQMKLYQVINNLSSIEIATVENSGSMPNTSDGIKAATVMFATVPILVIYPWLQRYFIAGVTVGAVKG